MKKRLFILGLILLLVAANSTMIFATNFSRKGDNSIGDALVNQAYELTTKSFKFSNNNIIIDVTPVEEKSTQAVSINGRISTMAAPTYTSRTKIINPIIDTQSSVSSSESSKLIDYIYARTRIYDKNGILNGVDTQSEENSSYVTASAFGDRSKCTAYGNLSLIHI